MRATLVRCFVVAAIGASAVGCSMCAGEAATVPPASVAPASAVASGAAAPLAAGAETAPTADQPVAAQVPLDPLAVLAGRWVGLRSGHAIVIRREGEAARVTHCADPSEHQPCDEGTSTTLGATFRATFFEEGYEPEGDEADEVTALFELELSLASSGETLHVRPLPAVEGSTVVEEDFRPSDMLEWARDSEEADAGHQDFYTNVVYRDDDEGEGEDEPEPSDGHGEVASDRALLLAVSRGALAQLGRNPRELDGEAALTIEERMFDVLGALECGDTDRRYAECEPLRDAATALLAAFLRTGIEPRSLIGAVPATITVSSALASRPPALMFDGDLATAWSSAHGDLVGASITLELPADAQVLEFLITPGYVGESLFAGNHRIARVRVTHTGDPPRELDVIERAGLVALGVAGGGGVWTIEILATRPGTRTDWTEICVSELRVLGISPAAGRDAVAPTYRVAPRP